MRKLILIALCLALVWAVARCAADVAVTFDHVKANAAQVDAL